MSNYTLTNYYFDDDGYFTYASPAHENSKPPKNATRVVPNFEEGMCPKLVDGKWHNVVDMRGTKYYTPDGVEIEIHDVEGIIPEGMLLEPPEPTPPVYTYVELRASEYSAIVEQLDRMWHDIDEERIPNAKNSEFYLKNKVVKDKYPKE